MLRGYNAFKLLPLKYPDKYILFLNDIMESKYLFFQKSLRTFLADLAYWLYFSKFFNMMNDFEHILSFQNAD